ncbi:hypothetical protein E2C01_020669 [Portunus trituberculatus]|uniref:Uncharacterized protein n=1 Tax=Portunus trituberculatus TaxID=210409 RepID=A0A5B7E273_PORTR|nr:hypothetical protein [Portunus trituberculatus]
MSSWCGDYLPRLPSLVRPWKDSTYARPVLSAAGKWYEASPLLCRPARVPPMSLTHCNTAETLKSLPPLQYFQAGSFGVFQALHIFKNKISITGFYTVLFRQINKSENSLMEEVGGFRQSGKPSAVPLTPAPPRAGGRRGNIDEIVIVSNTQPVPGDDVPCFPHNTTDEPQETTGKSSLTPSPTSTPSLAPSTPPVLGLLCQD